VVRNIKKIPVEVVLDGAEENFEIMDIPNNENACKYFNPFLMENGWNYIAEVSLGSDTFDWYS
jgi:hypothetical protein